MNAGAESPQAGERASLIAELRAGKKLLGKLFRLENGRRMIELACPGRGHAGLCYFDAETGLPVPALRYGRRAGRKRSRGAQAGSGQLGDRLIAAEHESIG